MSLIFFLLLSSITFANTLKLTPPKNWELKKNFLGHDYVLIEGTAGDNSLIMKKYPLSSLNGTLEDSLKKMIFDKANAQVPWKKIQISETIQLKSNNKKSGKVFVVEYQKDDKPFMGMIGGLVVGKDYYFIYFADQRESFLRKKGALLAFLN